VNIFINFNFGSLLTFFRLLGQRVAAGTQNTDVRGAVQSAGRAYLDAMRARFAREGDGTWPELARRTKIERGELGFPPAHPILRRLGYLGGALFPGAAGNVFEVMPNGIVMGYGGDFRHPGYVHPKTGQVSGGGNLAMIAYRHQMGLGVPARKILVQPNADTLEQMQQRITAGYRAVVANAVADSQTAGPLSAANNAA
jgi:hypothetical protein